MAIIILTPCDWLVALGMAVNLAAAWLMFRRLPATETPCDGW